MATRHLVALRLFQDAAGNAVVPGVAYAESITNIQSKIAFERLLDIYARIVVTAQGNGVGAGKGIEIYDATGAAQICEITWDGNALQAALAGAWTACNLLADSAISIRLKGSAAGEQITAYAVDFEVEY